MGRWRADRRFYAAYLAFLPALLLCGLLGACRGVAGYAPAPPDQRAAQDARGDGAGFDAQGDAVLRNDAARDAEPSPDLAPPSWMTVVDFTPTITNCGPTWVYDGTTQGCALPQPLKCEGNVESKVFAVPTGVVYERVRIEIEGLQWHSTDGFSVDTAPTSLDDIYLEGVSITTVEPRKHIYSFASGLYKTVNGYQSCPCQGGTLPPPFVGQNWTCDSGNTTTNYTAKWYTGQALWDGDSTGPGTSNNCAPPTQASVYEADLGAPTNQDIEVRLMQDGCDERVAIRKLKIEVFGVVGVPSP